MGEPLYRYQAPTGYPDRASQWMSSGALVERLNFGIALSNGKIAGSSVDLSRFGSASAEAVVDQAAQLLLGGDLSAQTRKVLLDQVRSSGEPAVPKTIALLLGSPEFQKR